MQLHLEKTALETEKKSKRKYVICKVKVCFQVMPYI